MARPEPRSAPTRRQAARLTQQANAGIVAAASSQAAVSDVVIGDLADSNPYLAEKFSDIADRLHALENP